VGPQAVRWAYHARADLLEALEYLAEQSPQAAAAFLDEIERAASSLSEFPARGAEVRELENPNLRQLVVGRYRLIYRVESGGVGIVRLIHGARDFREAWRKRPT
jgi:plasmid stabilization system protein ParE